MVEHKALVNLRKLKILSSTFSDHNFVRLRISYNLKNAKKQICGSYYYATEQPVGHWRNKEKIKQYLETNENETR